MTEQIVQVPEIKTTEDLDAQIKQYIEVRDTLKAFDDQVATARKPWSTMLDQLGGAIQRFLDAHSLENVATASGTAYKSSRTSASLADPAAFMNYVIENRAYDLLDRRANATAVKAFVEQHKQLPPGVNLSTVETLGVRRKSGSTPE